MKKIILILFIISFSNIYAAKPNILIICFNCLNKYHTGIYNHQKNLTPNLDKFSKNAYIFNNIISPANYTDFCTYELLTSKRSKYQCPEWKIIMNDFSYYKNILRENNYNLYFPNSLFGDVLSKYKTFKEPFFIFHHPNDLHSPYDIEFRKFKKLSKNKQIAIKKICEIIEKKVRYRKKIFYKILFGIPAKLYSEHIKDWNSILKKIKFSKKYILANSILSSGMLKSEYNKLNKINSIKSEKIKNIILKSLNKAISIKSRIIESKFIEYKNNILKIDNKIVKPVNKNKSYFIDENLIKQINIALNSQILKKDKNNNLKINNNLTNVDKYNLNRVQLYLLAYVFPSIADILIKKIQNTNHDPQKSIQKKIKKEITKDKIKIEKICKKYNIKREELIKEFYDINLKNEDKKFGYYLNKLKSNGYLKNTIIIVMGDHGEALLEHEQRGHGKETTNSEVISSLFMLRLPNQNNKKIVINNIVRFIDVMPTIFSLMRLKYDNTKIDGISLIKLLNGKTKDITAFFRTQDNIYSIIKNNGYKLIWNFRNDKKQLYNINTDKFDEFDISLKEEDIVADMQNELLELLY